MSDINPPPGKGGSGAFEDSDGDSVAELQDQHADFQGGDARNVGKLGAESLNNAEVIDPSGPGHDTLADAHAALPSGGGVIVLAGTPTETANVDITKPVKIVGQGMPFSLDAAEYIDLDGHTLHIRTQGVTVETLQAKNGKVIIGEHDVYGGRHEIGLCVRNSPGDAIELRGGSLDSHYALKANKAGSDGITWNLDADGVDYFNQNTVEVMAHSTTGNGVVMTGTGSGASEMYGNEFRRFDTENIDGTGWVVDSMIGLKSNEFTGYGIHDGGVDVQPAEHVGNRVHWSKCRGGGVLNLGGNFHAEDTGSQSLTTDYQTVHKITGTNRVLREAQPQRVSRELLPSGDLTHEEGAITVGTEATSLGTCHRSASLTVHGEVDGDGTISFVDEVSAIAYGSASSETKNERGSPPARSYGVTGDTLEASVDSGSVSVHVVKSVSSPK